MRDAAIGIFTLWSLKHSFPSLSQKKWNITNELELNQEH